MKWRVKKESGKYRLTGGAIAIISVSGVIVLALLVLGIGYAVISSKIAGDVPIVTKGTAAAATPSPTEDPGLTVVEGEPEDITEDYDDPAPAATQTSPIYYVEPLKQDVINILVIGSDSRSAEAGDGRCDTMMLLTYDVKNNKAYLSSFMRDIWVPIEGYGYNRLNATFVWGGVGLTINTINSLFGLDIQDYIIVDFDGMEELVDKLGGIDINITKTEASYYQKKLGLNISAGETHLNGAETLTHARNRKSNGGDFERTRRQRDVMLAIYKKISGTRDLGKITELLTYFMDHVETNVSANKMYTLATTIINSHGLTIDQARIPMDKTWKYANKGGRSVITIDFAANSKKLRQLLYGE